MGCVARFVQIGNAIAEVRTSPFVFNLREILAVSEGSVCLLDLTHGNDELARTCTHHSGTAVSRCQSAAALGKETVLDAMDFMKDVEPLEVTRGLEETTQVVMK